MARGRELDALTAAWLLGAVHFSVDTISGFVIFRDLMATGLPHDTIVGLVVLCNAIAFVGQAPVGVFADRYRLYGAVGVAGVVLAAVGLLLCPASIVPGLILVGAGNACFHVGAGALVLRASGDRATDSGIFVGPGALGLCTGIWLGGQPIPARGSILLVLAVAALLAWWGTRRLSTCPPHRAAGPRSAPAPAHRLPWVLLACAGCLLLCIALRAMVGGTVADAWRGVSWPVLWGIAVAACAGKIVGGWLADRFGWLATCVVALVLAAPLVSALVHAAPGAVLGMLLLQVTMPVTLKALHVLMPERPGLAFGLPCVVLLLGALPGLVGWGNPLSSGALVAAGMAVALAAVAGGIRLMVARASDL